MNKVRAKESGSVAVVVAVLMSLLLVITAFAVDFGYHFVVKNQVQNAADAAALAGADVLFRNAINPVNFSSKGGGSATTATNCSTTSPISSKAACTAAAAIAYNEHLTNAFSVKVDLWDNLSPPGPNNYPAVKVDLIQTSVPYFFARVLGFTTKDISASATAITRSAATVGIGAHVLPIAIDKCLFSGPSGFSGAIGLTFDLGEYHSAGCGTSGWSFLKWQSNDGGGANAIRNLISDAAAGGSGISTPLAIAPGAPQSTQDCSSNPGDGTCIHVKAGVTNSDCKAIRDTPGVVGSTFAAPVVAAVDGNSNQAVDGFVCVSVGVPDCKGSNKYIRLTILDGGCLLPGTGGGPSYHVTSPPQLAD
jgi:Flp pilus assembly protein TadG